MSTLAIMLAEIQSDTERSASADVTAMRNKIAAAIRFYQPRRFYFSESRAVTFPTVASTDTYSFATIGTEFYTIDDVFVLENGRQHCLKVVDYLELETLIETSPSTGRPYNYAKIGTSLRFWPVPDAAYTIRPVGHIKVAAPETDDEANNPWMVEAYDLIMSRAKAELYAHRWEDPNSALVMRQAEQIALASLASATTSRASTGTLVPSGVL